MSTSLPTIEEQIAWAEELAAFQARNIFTAVETGRMSQAEAERKRALGAAVVESLRAARLDITHTIEKDAAAGRMRSPLAVVRITCGGAYENIAVLNADLAATDARWHAAFMGHVGARMVAVIRQGLKLT